MTQRTEPAIEAARRGERWAEEEITRRMQRYARHVCGGQRASGIPELDWEDVAQEAATRFFTVGIHRFRSGESENAYLYAFTRRAYLHVSRGAWRRKQRESAVEPHDRGESNPETRTLLGQILGSLSQACQELLQRLYFDGATYGELATDLGLKESSVRARASRCLGNARDHVS